MAEMANAPVLLAGDIDRGGVFASLYGTVALLEPQERARIRGLIINKFRGDVELLRPGLAMLEEKTGVPVLGVVPYTCADIDDEDSLAPCLAQTQQRRPLDIAVVRLPRISNFTDFSPLESHPALGVRYVERAGQLGEPDLVVLPGTKNTMGDLAWMRQNGLEAEVLKAAAGGTPVMGICGGFQMLGETLSDPHGVEAGGTLRGMGLLPMDTVFEKQKTRTQTKGKFRPLAGCFSELSGVSFYGYEIHMGRTAIDRENGAMDTAMLVSWRREPVICRPVSYVMEIQDRDRPGCDGKRVKEDGWNRGNIYGAYIHGIFDHPGIAETIVSSLAAKKGISMDEVKAGDYSAYRQQQYDKLADVLRSSLDMDAIYKMMGL